MLESCWIICPIYWLTVGSHKAWLSYILDNFATIDEAVAAIKNDVRLAAVKLPIAYATDTKHMAIEDETVDSTIIEIDNGIVNIYHNKNYRVMPNPANNLIITKQ